MKLPSDSKLGFHCLVTLVASLTVPMPHHVFGQAADSDATDLRLEDRRMALMRERALAITFQSSARRIPQRLQSEPLFRYDDVPRGYVDGAVWRLGADGRPLAIITTELHPKYLGSSSRVVYDFLSLSPFPFSANSPDASWTPSESAVVMQRLETAPTPARSASLRLFQMKRIMARFSASQVVSKEVPDEKKLSLRLLPRPIDRYKPVGKGSADKRSDHDGEITVDPVPSDHSDGAAFLFVAGRMPGVIVFLETDGAEWSFGIGRLSAPSTLSVRVDGNEVYRVPPNFGTWSGSYNASNSPAKIPGFD